MTETSRLSPGAGGRGSGHRVVLFDFDGTLADTIPLIIASFRHTVSRVVGEEVTDARARSWIGRTLMDIFGEHYPRHTEAMVEEYRSWNLRHHDELIRAIDGVQGLLDALVAAGFRLGVVSSKGEHVVRRGLAAVGLEHDFEVVVGLEATAVHKPLPDPLLHAAGVLAVDPGECVYVGDAVVDIRAARAAGMRAVGVTWGAGTAEELWAVGADAVTDTAGELLGILT